MWLLAGVRLLRALRMSHRFTFFLLVWFVLFACVLLFWLCLVPCFACAAGFLFDYSCGCIQMTDHASTLVRLC